jgi:hypothetical protein
VNQQTQAAIEPPNTPDEDEDEVTIRHLPMGYAASLQSGDEEVCGQRFEGAVYPDGRVEVHIVALAGVEPFSEPEHAVVKYVRDAVDSSTKFAAEYDLRRAEEFLAKYDALLAEYDVVRDV